jgi:hypothetical protein
LKYEIKIVYFILCYVVRYLKLGFAGTNFPKETLPAMIGRPMLRADEKLDGIELKVIKILRIIFFLFDLLFNRIL